jgi:hypothetical protein
MRESIAFFTIFLYYSSTTRQLRFGGSSHNAGENRICLAVGWHSAMVLSVNAIV